MDVHFFQVSFFLAFSRMYLLPFLALGSFTLRFDYAHDSLRSLQIDCSYAYHSFAISCRLPLADRH